MGHARDADPLSGIVDDVDHAPVSNPDAPLIFIALKLLASRRSGIIGQPENFAVNAGEHQIIKGAELLLCGKLDFDGVASHATGGASNGWRDTARKACLFPYGAIRK